MRKDIRGRSAQFPGGFPESGGGRLCAGAMERQSVSCQYPGEVSLSSWRVLGAFHAVPLNSRATQRHERSCSSRSMNEIDAPLILPEGHKLSASGTPTRASRSLRSWEHKNRPVLSGGPCCAVASLDPPTQGNEGFPGQIENVLARFLLGSHFTFPPFCLSPLLYFNSMPVLYVFFVFLFGV